jgi:hypothetical protein
MIRITNEQGKSLVVSLVAFEEIREGRAVVGDSVTDILENRANSDPAFRDTYEILYGYDDNGLPVDSPSDQIAFIVNQLKQRNPPEVIDTLVELIGDRYARNFLAGSNLQELRNSLLRSDELSALSKIRSIISCAGCGHPFNPGGRSGAELVALTRENLEYVFYCPRCAVPTHLSCSKGCKGGVVEIPTSVQKELLKKHTCATCGSEGQAATGTTAANLGIVPSGTTLTFSDDGVYWSGAPPVASPSRTSARSAAGNTLLDTVRRTMRNR